MNPKPKPETIEEAAAKLIASVEKDGHEYDGEDDDVIYGDPYEEE